MKTELITIDETTALEIFTKPDGLESAIQQIEKIARSIVPDVSTDKGRKSIRSAASKIASGKVKLDDLGKAVAADAKATVKLIDGNRRVVRDRLDALKAEIRSPLTEFENTEKQRIERISEKIQFIKSLAITYDEYGDKLTTDQMFENLCMIEKYTVDKSFDEFQDSAMKVKAKAYQSLESELTLMKAAIAKDAELERLRQEAEDRKKKGYEDEMKRRAAEGARIEAERKAREDSVRIEYEKQEAVRQKDEAKLQAEASEKARIMALQMAKDAAADAEQRHLDDIEDARQEEIYRQREESALKKSREEERALNIKWTNKIKTQARNDLMDIFHIDADFSSDIVDAIDAGKITNVIIKY